MLSNFVTKSETRGISTLRLTRPSAVTSAMPQCLIVSSMSSRACMPSTENASQPFWEMRSMLRKTRKSEFLLTNCALTTARLTLSSKWKIFRWKLKPRQTPVRTSPCFLVSLQASLTSSLSQSVWRVECLPTCRCRTNFSSTQWCQRVKLSSNSVSGTRL